MNFCIDYMALLPNFVVKLNFVPQTYFDAVATCRSEGSVLLFNVSSS